jgi:hypothetical protein
MTRYRHKKRGTVYEYIGTAKVQALVPVEENDVVAIYRGENGCLWVRPIAEFKDGRFEQLDPALPPANDYMP